MATFFWILLMLYPVVSHSQSGDDGESIDADCWSLMTSNQSSLVCILTDCDLDICEKFATLCSVVPQGDDAVCSNATIENNRIMFQHLSHDLKYTLHLYLKGGRTQTEKYSLWKMVKLTAPDIENITHKHNQVVIHIRYMHDYVKNPNFQLQFWGNQSINKQELMVKHKLVTIHDHNLRDSEQYHIRVRAKPVDLYDGSWTEWSPVKSFKVIHTKVKESIHTDCWSLMNLKQSSLVCMLKDSDLNLFRKLPTLCSVVPKGNNAVCFNATIENNRIMFRDLSPISTYTLHLYLKGGGVQTVTCNLVKMVKITTPEIENVTYKRDDAVIHIKYSHDYVQNPEFLVQFWGDQPENKQDVKVKYKALTVGGDQLRNSEIYHVHVRAKPVDYFNGSWTEWSPVKSFKHNHTKMKREEHSVLYVLFCIIPIMVVAAVLIARWKKEIQTYLFPTIPDPKATLAQIHRQNEHLPVSFSPEIFKDINIYPVICTEEKQFTSESDDEQHGTTDSCDDDTAALKCFCPSAMSGEVNEDESVPKDSQTSQMTMKLLDECTSAEGVHETPGCHSATALQRHSKDETYVTMSSLYKIQ